MKLIIRLTDFGLRAGPMWNCIDDDTYDGAPDAGFLAHIQGWGDTPEAALHDWQDQYDDWSSDQEFIAARNRERAGDYSCE